MAHQMQISEAFDRDHPTLIETTRNSLIRHFSWNESFFDATIDESLQRAKHNIDVNYHVVLLTDRFEESVDLLCFRLACQPLDRASYLRKASRQIPYADLSTPAKRKLDALCAADMDLYDHAKAQFAQRQADLRRSAIVRTVVADRVRHAAIMGGRAMPVSIVDFHVYSVNTSNQKLRYHDSACFCATLSFDRAYEDCVIDIAVYN